MMTSLYENEAIHNHRTLVVALLRHACQTISERAGVDGQRVGIGQTGVDCDGLPSLVTGPQLNEQISGRCRRRSEMTSEDCGGCVFTEPLVLCNTR
jgi:hypothetical protein